MLSTLYGYSERLCAKLQTTFSAFGDFAPELSTTGSAPGVHWVL